MESKPIDWSHLMLLLVVLVSLHGCSHAQGTTTTWEGSSLKQTLSDSRFSIIVIAILACIVFLIIISLVFRHCVDSCAEDTRTHNAAASERRRRELIDNCPVLVYSEVNELRIGNSALECAVCLTEFEDTDKIRLLPNCNHVFHTDCIDRWFASPLTCPVCRARLTDSDNADDDAVTESNHDESTDSSDAEIEQQSTVESPETAEEEMMIDVDPAAETEPRFWSRTAAAERFARSHSTGHSLIMESEGMIERYTLRLPEHVREEIFGREKGNNNHNKLLLRRCSSNNDVVLQGEWSLKEESDDMDMWTLMISMTPPFVSTDYWSSVKFLKQNTDQSSSSSSPPPSPRPPV